MSDQLNAWATTETTGEKNLEKSSSARGLNPGPLHENKALRYLGTGEWSKLHDTYSIYLMTN